MAWKGKVASKKLDQLSGTLTLEIDFYDDVDPATMIVRRQISVPASFTLAEIQVLVRADGMRERAKFNDLKALDGRIAVGAEVTV